MHPLSTIHWEEWFQSSLFKSRGGIRILFKDKPYLFTDEGILLYNYDLDSLAKVKLPSKKMYGVSTYRSQLVLVGGLDPTTEQATNKVWVSDDGSKWEPSLPPLPIACTSPIVVSTGSPEHLMIVIGGKLKEDCMDVYILIGEQWMLAQPLPMKYFSLLSRWRVISHGLESVTHTIHNRNLLLSKGQTPSLYCNLDTLLSTASLGSFTESATNSVWREFAVPKHSCHLLSLGNCVTAAGSIHPSTAWRGTVLPHVSEQAIQRTPKICAYSPVTESWVQVGDIPYSYSRLSNSSPVLGSLASLGGELVLVTPQNDVQQKLFKATVKSKWFHIAMHYAHPY